MENNENRCPCCGSQAIYRYGRIKNGKQRYLCIMCGRQYTPDKERHEISNRPTCSVCGKPMNCYKREVRSLRFRCSGYPRCKTYKKVISKEGLTI